MGGGLDYIKFLFKSEKKKKKILYEMGIQIQKIINRKKKLLDKGVLVDLEFDKRMEEKSFVLNCGDAFLNLFGESYNYDKMKEISIMDRLYDLVENEEIDEENINNLYYFFIGYLKETKKAID
jgi:hypothetical protein|tara:strand:+ start:1336 stop:1704 length:369 start_codon:yes stop_codon:yes gene_type:complete